MLLIILCLAIVNSQYFESGIKRSTPFAQNDNNYTISSTINSTDLDVIISIATFNSFNVKTSCFVYNKGQISVSLTCTNNLQSFFYLFYQRTPMVYSNHYDYYFYEGNEQTSVKWQVPINQTIISKYQLRAFMTTVVQIESLNMYVSIRATEDNLGFNISRSVNVRRIGFYFIIIQTAFPYSHTFQNIDISAYYKNSRLPNINGKIWGIQTIYISKEFTNQSVYILSKPGRKILEISQNINLQGFIISLQSYRPYCNGFYLPSRQICNETCSLTVVSKTVNGFTLKYCVANNTNSTKAYVSNNLDQAVNYSFAGCKKVAVSEISAVTCISCAESYVVLNQKCVCGMGTYLNGTTCRPCNSQVCPTIGQYQILITSNNLTSSNLSISIDLAQNVQYLLESAPKFTINAIINNQSYPTTAYYNSSLKSISILLQYIQASSKYVISLSSDTSANGSSLFLVKNMNATYLWSVQINNLIRSLPVSTQSIMGELSPAFSQTDKTIPALMVTAFVIGHKVNAFPLFQTVSMLYLITFINLDIHYNDLSSIIRSIFIFQPSTLLNITGPNSYLPLPSVNISKIHYDMKIFTYTQGEYYLGMGANGIIMLLSQIGLIYSVIKLLKKIFNRSRNEVMPNHENVTASDRQRCQSIRRSTVKADGYISWLKQPHPQQKSSLRDKIYFKICLIDSKKTSIFLSILSVHMISHSFLILHEFTLPFTDNFSIYSRLASSICFMFILLLPGLLVNHQPLELLKAAGIIYKRRRYKIWQISLYFYTLYIENVILPLAVVSFSNGTLQILAITFLSILKYLVLRKVIKILDAIKQFAIICLFITLLLTFLLPLAFISQIKQTIIATILFILAIEFLKLLRSILIVLLNLFKQSTFSPQLSPQIDEKNDKAKLILPSVESETNPIDIEHQAVNQPPKTEPFTIPHRPRKRRFRSKPPKQGDKHEEVGNHQEIN